MSLRTVFRRIRTLLGPPFRKPPLWLARSRWVFFREMPGCCHKASGHLRTMHFARTRREGLEGV